jgi:hypothetical protein
MDTGRVVEFDHPHNLLKNKDGFLYSMVKETGPDTADLLQAVATEVCCSTEILRLNRTYNLKRFDYFFQSFKNLQIKKESLITYIDDGV